jgi:hypothetical protein
MFMTALGSLIFIAMLLVFLLPKTAQTSTADPRQATKALEAELETVREQLASEQRWRRDLQQMMKSVREVDKLVVKRWMVVTLLTKGCPADEPALSVRWEGDTFHFETREYLGKLPEFDASAPRLHPLVGNRMFRIGPASLPSRLEASTSLLDGTGLAAASFLVVSNGPGEWSVYVSLKDPRGLKGGECLVQPIVYGSSGQAVDSELKLSLAQPFAFVRRVRLENNGGLTSRAPKYDTAFQRELEEFSVKQSKKLCEKKLICGTQDAHWAMYAKPLPPPPEILEWRSSYQSTSRDDRYDVKQSMTVAGCTRACIDDPRCVAVEHDDDRKTCSLYDTRPLVRGAPGARWKVGFRVPSPLDWRPDHAVEGGEVYRSLAETSQEDCSKACVDDPRCRLVEYYKPARSCEMFASVPKIVPSPIRPYGPTDVGVRAKR